MHRVYVYLMGSAYDYEDNMMLHSILKGHARYFGIDQHLLSFVDILANINAGQRDKTFVS